jgi:PKD repeat protein
VDGSYQVTLTVTDNAGSSGTVAHAVVVAAANQSPVAAFTSSVSGLTASLDGSGSSDPDGTVASYSWDFGDGSAAGSGAKPTHSYAAGGSYQVTLTVTDNQGATSAVAKPVAVSAAQGPFAADLFARTVSSGWGPADQGGSWTVAGGAANFSVAAGTAKMKIPSAGATDAATLSTVSQTGADVGVSFTSDLPATGGGLYFSTAVRRVGNTFYSSKILVGSTGKVTLNLMKTVSGTETTLKAVVATGLTYTPGMVLRVRLQALGSGTTTLNAKVWQDGQVEPSAWLATATDTTVALQSPGAVGVIGYLSGTATNAPVTWSVQNFVATAPAA